MWIKNNLGIFKKPIHVDLWLWTDTLPGCDNTWQHSSLNHFLDLSIPVLKWTLKLPEGQTLWPFYPPLLFDPMGLLERLGVISVNLTSCESMLICCFLDALVTPDDCTFEALQHAVDQRLNVARSSIYHPTILVKSHLSQQASSNRSRQASATISGTTSLAHHELSYYKTFTSKVIKGDAMNERFFEFELLFHFKKPWQLIK